MLMLVLIGGPIKHTINHTSNVYTAFSITGTLKSVGSIVFSLSCASANFQANLTWLSPTGSPCLTWSLSCRLSFPRRSRLETWILGSERNLFFCSWPIRFTWLDICLPQVHHGQCGLCGDLDVRDHGPGGISILRQRHTGTAQMLQLQYVSHCRHLIWILL